MKCILLGTNSLSNNTLNATTNSLSNSTFNATTNSSVNSSYIIENGERLTTESNFLQPVKILHNENIFGRKIILSSSNPTASLTQTTAAVIPITPDKKTTIKPLILELSTDTVIMNPTIVTTKTAPIQVVSNTTMPSVQNSTNKQINATAISVTTTTTKISDTVENMTTTDLPDQTEPTNNIDGLKKYRVCSIFYLATICKDTISADTNENINYDNEPTVNVELENVDQIKPYMVNTINHAFDPFSNFLKLFVRKYQNTDY